MEEYSKLCRLLVQSTFQKEFNKASTSCVMGTLVQIQCHENKEVMIDYFMKWLTPQNNSRPISDRSLNGMCESVEYSRNFSFF